MSDGSSPSLLDSRSARSCALPKPGRFGLFESESGSASWSVIAVAKSSASPSVLPVNGILTAKMLLWLMLPSAPASCLIRPSRLPAEMLLKSRS